MATRRTRADKPAARSATPPRGDDRAAVDVFFRDRPEARRLFEGVAAAVRTVGASTMGVTKSQIAFKRKRGFAWVWTPDRWLRGATAPLVLSIGLRHRLRSRRWKEVVEPRPGRWMHHLEVRSLDDLDAEVQGWIARAWDEAG